MSEILYLSVALFLVLLNGIFVAAEFAMVKIRSSQIDSIRTSKKLYNKILIKINQNLDAYLSACQLGITLTSLGLGWIGEPAMAHLLMPIIHILHLSNPTAIDAFAFTCAFVLISFLHIVIGELLPKSISIRYPFKTSVVTSIPIYVFYYLTYPIIWVLNLCSNFLLRVFFRSNNSHESNFYTTNELKFILDLSVSHGEITRDEAMIMEHTLDFADLRITEIMRPRDELVCIDVDDDYQDIINLLLKTKYTRYPVYKHNMTKIIGMIHVKDFFINNLADEEVNIQKLIRPILQVSVKSTALDVLNKFRNTGSHLALIYKGKRLLGFVTLDNLLHIIIGSIKDEFHRTRDDWVRDQSGVVITDGDCSIYALEQALDVEINANEDGIADNVGQLIFHILKRMPNLNEIIIIEDIQFTILEVIGQNIVRLSAKKIIDEII